jgi:hypothetical protein
MRKTSKDVLTESLERRMKHIMVQLLNQFDERFPDLREDQQGRLFKFDIKNQFNDAIRATRDEIRDYDIEYRPIRFNPDNTLSVTKAFIEGVQHIYFNSISPGIKILAAFSPDNCRILEAIRRELGTGIVYSSMDNKTVTFSVNGLENCIDAVIPFMDLYKLLSPVQSEYTAWRNIVIGVYNGDR